MREDYKAWKEEANNDFTESPIKPTNKRSRDEDEDESDNGNSEKRIKVTNDNDNSSISTPKDSGSKQSNVDFVLEKQSLELPPIPDGDGGAD
jgi:hypothetical protein